MERKLASIQIITSLNKIEGADLIEVATVNAWHLVTKKGEYTAGDKAIYCEIDSFLPLAPEFEFLRKTSFKRMGEIEGFRLKTIKMRGQVSQGLLLPLTTLESRLTATEISALKVGDDVTAALGIIKYEPPIPAQLAGMMKGDFPSFIPKTDQKRVQNLAETFVQLRAKKYYISEKLDGSSATYYAHNGEFGVCSRNLELLETADNTFWKVARQLGLEEKLKSVGNIALQGELIGENIQKNPYRLKGQSVYFFSAFDIDKYKYYPYADFMALMERLSLNSVPIVAQDYTLPETIDELLNLAEGKSLLCNTAEREGFVITSMQRDVTFKAISNRFLLAE